MDCDIWAQTPAQRNYEFWNFICQSTGRDKNTYRPYIEAKERRQKEIYESKQSKEIR